MAARRDVCRACGREIRPGNIFVLARVTCCGRAGWMPMHLACRASMRGDELPAPRGGPVAMPAGRIPRSLTAIADERGGGMLWAGNGTTDAEGSAGDSRAI